MKTWKIVTTMRMIESIREEITKRTMNHKMC